DDGSETVLFGKRITARVRRGQRGAICHRDADDGFRIMYACAAARRTPSTGSWWASEARLLVETTSPNSARASAAVARTLALESTSDSRSNGRAARSPK